MRNLIIASLLLLAPVASADVWRHVPGVRVTVAPPALKFESPPPAPSRRHMWVPGYWGWAGGKHVWMEGHWAIPPHHGDVWEPARWAQENGAWMFYEGHWRAGDEPDAAVVYQPPAPPVHEVVVEVAPPTPIVEVKPAPPFGGAVWIPGYWHWAGHRHVWVAGRWSAPAPGHHWEGDQWEKREGKYVHRPGYWERDRH
jgi:WXXGXW repeat (2 copies)